MINWPKIRREFFEYYTKDLDSIQIYEWFKNKLTKKKRTNKQNSALHLYFTQLANQLNDAGYTFTNVIGIEIKFTTELIKESIWKPTQLEMYGIKSTTKLTTDMINELIDVFSLHFGQKGIYVEFPNFYSFLNKMDSERYIN